MSVDRSEVVAAQGVGIGIGLIALMLTWLGGSRLAELAWDPPVGPVVAFATAVIVGVVTSIVFAHRLTERVRREPSGEGRGSSQSSAVKVGARQPSSAKR